MSDHMERAWEFLGGEFGLTDSQADYAAHQILDRVLAELKASRELADRLKARRNEATEEYERVKGQLDVVVALVYAMGSMELIQHVAPVAFPDE